MAEVPVTVRQSKIDPPNELVAALAEAIAALLGYQISVADREDRLESGTGTWKQAMSSEERSRAARRAVLRTLSMAGSVANFDVLEAVVGGAKTYGDLALATGHTRLVLAEPISDLISCGLLAKVPERGSVVATTAGEEVVRLVELTSARVTRMLGSSS